MEAEALLEGPWKNIEELEECITLEELQILIKAIRDKEHRTFKFMGALKGVDIDEKTDQKDRFEEIKRRAEARRQGVNVEKMELEEFGLDIIEED